MRCVTSASAVTIINRISEHRLEITLHNHGEPNAAEHRPRLFECFYRCVLSQPTDANGSGLAIVRTFMQLHGGRVSIDTTEAGTRFHLEFPLINAWTRTKGIAPDTANAGKLPYNEFCCTGD
ncbi:sensor histidine kinase [Pseudomonas moorei]|uniref:sensor histidine kinase n=1 Tax=Pseudomonas moorei TaxID=395599 RepID=UPI001BB069E4